MKKALPTLLALTNIYLLMAQPAGEVRDVDGNTYQVVLIGGKEWMAENLKTTRFSDGTPIPMVTNSIEWNHMSSPAYCWYGNDATSDGYEYGTLYNWYAVNTNRLCPAGWHVPEDSEWSGLAGYLGGEPVTGGTILLNGDLKSERTAPGDHPRWDLPNKGATNKTGFSALPGGSRSYVGIFSYLGEIGFWWSASGKRELAWHTGMRWDNENMFRNQAHKTNGFSVRCVKDKPVEPVK